MTNFTQNHKRNLNLDLIRTVAVFSVLSVHFFLNSEFYNTVITGTKLYVATLMRNMFMVCVPLFLLLTGYLMNKKKRSNSYYSGIKKTITTYLVATLFIIAFRIFILHEHITLFDMLINVTSFQQYSWYIEMYIGLFLLIPYLNIVYSNLATKKEKLILIFTLLFLYTLPSLLNTLDLQTLDWWVNLYPLTYYYLGSFIQEYQDEIKLSLKYNFILLFFSFLVFGSYSYYRSYNSIFIWGSWCDWGGFSNVITSILLFVFLLRIDIKTMPLFFKNCIVSISKLSLGIYLLSWIFDKYNYPILNRMVPNIANRLPYYFIIVPINFLLGYLLSFFVDKISNFLCALSLPKITCHKQ